MNRHKRNWREIVAERNLIVRDSLSNERVNMRNFVARRARFASNEFEVVQLPKLNVVAQGYSTQEDAEQAAREFTEDQRKGHSK